MREWVRSKTGCGIRVRGRLRCGLGLGWVASVKFGTVAVVCFYTTLLLYILDCNQCTLITVLLVTSVTVGPS